MFSPEIEGSNWEYLNTMNDMRYFEAKNNLQSFVKLVPVESAHPPIRRTPPSASSTRLPPPMPNGSSGINSKH